MKITEVRAVPLAIPLREVDPPSAWAAGAGKQILVRLTTDEGLTGWGECFAYGAPMAVISVVDDALAPLVLGQDPTQIEDRKSTRLNSSHLGISYAVFCL